MTSWREQSSLVKTASRTQVSISPRSTRSSWSVECPECPRFKSWSKISSERLPTSQSTPMRLSQSVPPSKEEFSRVTLRTFCCWMSLPCPSVSRLSEVSSPEWSPETPLSPPRKLKPTQLPATTKPLSPSECSKVNVKWPPITRSSVNSIWEVFPPLPEESHKLTLLLTSTPTVSCTSLPRIRPPTETTQSPSNHQEVWARVRSKIWSTKLKSSRTRIKREE